MSDKTLEKDIIIATHSYIDKAARYKERLEEYEKDLLIKSRLETAVLCKFCYYLRKYQSIDLKYNCRNCDSLIHFPYTLCLDCSKLNHACSWCLADLFNETDRSTHKKVVAKAEKLLKDGPNKQFTPSVIETKDEDDLGLTFELW